MQTGDTYSQLCVNVHERLRIIFVHNDRSVWIHHLLEFQDEHNAKYNIFFILLFNSSRTYVVSVTCSIQAIGGNTTREGQFWQNKKIMYKKYIKIKWDSYKYENLLYKQV